MKQSKTTILQELLQSLTGDETIYGVWYIEYRGRGGWYAVPDSARYFGDNGEYLGCDYREAVKAIRELFTKAS